MTIDQLILIFLIGSVLVFFKMPDIFRRIRSRYMMIEEMEEISEHPFVCPNCGERFYGKWGRFRGLNNRKLIQWDLYGKVRLKCPYCGQTDWCRWTGKDRL